MKSGSVVGAPGGHHGDVLRVKGGGRGEARVRVAGVRMGRVRVRMRVRVRVARVRAHRGCGGRGRCRGPTRVPSERVMRRVRLHPMLPRGRRCSSLLPSNETNQIIQSDPPLRANSCFVKVCSFWIG